MPLIEVHVIENVFNAEQKRQMISKLTDAMVSIEGENMRGVTWVKISEVASGDGASAVSSDHGSRQGSRGRPKGGLTRFALHRRRAGPRRAVLPYFDLHAAVSGAPPFAAPKPADTMLAAGLR